MTDAEARALMERYWAAFAAMDVEGAIACFTDDAVYEDTVVQEVATGKDAVRGLWRMWFDAASEDFDAHLDGMVAHAGGYALEWTVSGTLTGSFGMLTGDGQHFSIRGSSVGEFRDGLISGNRDYWNLAAVLAQFGVIELPGAPAQA